LFTPSNVRNGEFVYSSSARRARHNAAVVQWNNPENGYRMEPELYEMDDRIEEMGLRFQLDRVAFGCTSRGQALRDARWALFTENNQTETITFGAGLEGAQLRPGDIVAVMDPRRSGKSWGGRVKGVEGSGNVIVLDREVRVDECCSHNLIVTMGDGKIAEGQVIGPAGITDRVRLFKSNMGASGVQSAAPDVVEGAVWVLASEKTTPDLWRVVSVAMDGEGEYSITALEHAPEKYEWVEQGIEFTDRRKWTGGDSEPLPLRPPLRLTLKEYLYKDKEDLKVGVQAMWRPRPEHVRFCPSYRVDGGNWTEMPETSQPCIEIAPIEAPCRLSFAVGARILGGGATPEASAELDVLGKTAPPSDVPGFGVTCADGLALAFSWDECLDLDFSCYELREGKEWDAAKVLATGLAANSFQAPVGWTAPEGRTFLIKVRDTSGNWSRSAASATLATYGHSDPDVLTVERKMALAAQMEAYDAELVRLAALAAELRADLLAQAEEEPESPDALDAAETAAFAGFDNFFHFFAERDDPAPWDDLSGPTYLNEGGGAELSRLLCSMDGALKGLADALSDAKLDDADFKWKRLLAADKSGLQKEIGKLVGDVIDLHNVTEGIRDGLQAEIGTLADRLAGDVEDLHNVTEGIRGRADAAADGVGALADRLFGSPGDPEGPQGEIVKLMAANAALAAANEGLGAWLGSLTDAVMDLAPAGDPDPGDADDPCPAGGQHSYKRGVCWKCGGTLAANTGP
jgi:hypothetical protein